MMPAGTHVQIDLTPMNGGKGSEPGIAGGPDRETFAAVKGAAHVVVISRADGVQVVPHLVNGGRLGWLGPVGRIVQRCANHQCAAPEVFVLPPGAVAFLGLFPVRFVLQAHPVSPSARIISTDCLLLHDFLYSHCYRLEQAFQAAWRHERWLFLVEAFSITILR